MMKIVLNVLTIMRKKVLHTFANTNNACFDEDLFELKKKPFSEITDSEMDISLFHNIRQRRS
jgi:hypothetical protein